LASTTHTDLSSGTRQAAGRSEEVAFGEEIKEDPFLAGKVQKLKGYYEYHKMRFGGYRAGIRIDFEERVVEFRRVRHRKDLYREFP